MFCIHKIISSNLIISKPLKNKSMFKPRLQTNYNLIDKYDLIDKYFFSEQLLSKLNKINTFCMIDQTTSKKLHSILIKEYSANQKTVLQNSLLTNLKITICKNYNYTYLEILLHTQLLNSTINKININNSTKTYCIVYTVCKNLSLFYNDNFISNINLDSSIRLSAVNNIWITFTNFTLFIPLHFLT
uniref:Uncharacterized protein n=1 Tax=Calliarthron tuberculosum TaxID=48942 RepID=A0A0F7EW81_CALTB|nr:hypothetical protein [Calliarthron tuberculosum]AKG26275.1 hypothetical protein [Calliarthron tuberculosum]